MKKLLRLMLSAALLGALCLPAAAEEASAPSAWAAGEVERAVALGFVPGDLQGGWQEPVTRAEFAQMALFFLAVQHNYPTSYEGFNYAEAKPIGTVWSIDGFIDDYCVYQTDRDGRPFEWADYVADYDPDADYGDGNWHMQFYGTERWFSDVTDPFDQLYVNAAYAFGLVNGKGGGRFDPEGPITRQEAAAMLVRVYGNYGGAVDAPDAAPFADAARIADWARADVYRATAGLGVMEGTGGSFDPLGTYTREQCAITFLRMYENAPVSRARGNVPRLMPFDDEVQRFYDMGDFYLFRRFDTPDCTALYANHGGHMHAYSALHVIYRGGGSRTVELYAAVCGLSADQGVFYYVTGAESGRNYVAKALDLATLRSAPTPGRGEAAALIKGQEGFTLEAELSAGDCTVIYGSTPKGEYAGGGPELWALRGDGAVVRYWSGLPGVNREGWMADPGWLPPLRNLSLSGDGRTLTFEAAYGGGTVWYAYSADTASGAVTQIK